MLFSVKLDLCTALKTAVKADCKYLFKYHQ